MRIQHNILAMNAYRNYTNNTNALGKNLEKLSSGYRINRAGDDAAGLAISEKMRAQITGLDAAQKNVKDGISLVKTAEGAMQEIQDMLNRMDYLATQSANGTYQNEVDRENLQKEVNSLRTEINRIADSSNFNGIKLLDGSLADSVSANKIVISGDAVTKAKVAAVKGVVETQVAPTTTVIKSAGDSVSFSIGLSDGTSRTIELTAKQDPTTAANLVFTDSTGKTYGASFTKAAGATDAQIGAAVLAALQEDKTLTDNFTITQSAGKFTFTNATAGSTGVLQVESADWKVIVDGAANPTTGVAGTTIKHTTLAQDEYYTLTGVTEYNGGNYDDAVFTINGKKFVLLTEGHTGATLGSPIPSTGNSEDMHTALGLGSDVTILVGGTDGITKGDDNLNQNMQAIADATGLKVSVGSTAGDPIRLSVGGSGKGGGLTLQIGDTADSFNQLKVSIGDMHAKGMGIQNVDISTQSGAQSAIETIKNAINYVSSVRGDLGAVQNRLEHTQNNLAVMQENIQDAESTIRDTDVAAEMMAYTKNNILVQSAQAMLAQANAVPQGVLQLLQ